MGLTGSIGMGKSTIANQLIRLGFPVFDADKEVHRLYSAGGEAVKPISELFPDAIGTDGAVNRTVLMEKVMADAQTIKLIESIVHPLVIDFRKRFFEDAQASGHLLVVYDIPLLFENRAKYEVDYIIVVTAGPEVQRQRVLARAGMTPEKFESIVAKQVPDNIKRQQADFIINTDYEGYVEGKAQLALAIEGIIEREPERWAQWKKQQSSMGTVARASIDDDFKAQDHIDLILFDLDDTLVPTMQPIKGALKALDQFMQEKMPNSSLRDPTDLRSLMNRC